MDFVERSCIVTAMVCFVVLVVSAIWLIALT